MFCQFSIKKKNRKMNLNVQTIIGEKGNVYGIAINNKFFFVIIIRRKKFLIIFHIRFENKSIRMNRLNLKKEIK